MIPSFDLLEPRRTPSVAPGWNALEYQSVLQHGGWHDELPDGRVAFDWGGRTVIYTPYVRDVPTQAPASAVLAVAPVGISDWQHVRNLGVIEIVERDALLPDAAHPMGQLLPSATLTQSKVEDVDPGPGIVLAAYWRQAHDGPDVGFEPDGGWGPWIEMPVPDWLRHPVTME